MEPLIKQQKKTNFKKGNQNNYDGISKMVFRTTVQMTGNPKESFEFKS